MAPPDFKTYAFGPPQISKHMLSAPPRFQNQKLTNISWKALLSMYYSFSSVSFMCIYMYMGKKKIIRFPILFSAPPGCDMFLRLCYRIFKLPKLANIIKFQIAMM